MALLVAVWWFACARAAAIHGRGSDWLLGWMPWTGRMLQCSRTATFLEVLALLVENQSPLPESLVLAAEASGDAPTLRSARQMAAALERGQTDGGASAFPPLLDWLLQAAGRDGALLPALRHAADGYHRRARHQAELLRVFLPIVLVVVLAGGATALYALTLFAPYAAMLRALAR
jgi:type II secretory pathway component PulF